MNHGGIVQCFDDQISLRPSFVPPLAVRHRSVMWSIPYPRPAENLDKRYAGVPKLVDFIITPLEFRYWCASARINIEVRNSKGSISAVLDSLSRQELTILSADCSRSGHRYATLSFVIGLEDVAAKFNSNPQAMTPMEYRSSMDVAL